MQRIKNREKELRLGNFENNDEEILDLAQHIYILLTILKGHFPNAKKLAYFQIRKKYTKDFFEQCHIKKVVKMHENFEKWKKKRFGSMSDVGDQQYQYSEGSGLNSL